MSIVLNRGASADVGYLGAAYSQDPNKRRVGMMVRVNDPAVGEQVPGYNWHTERPFAGIPDKTSSTGWREISLEYSGTERWGSRPQDWEDMFVHWGDYTTDQLDLMKNQGVYFGMDTSAGRVWMQHPDQNRKPRELR